MKHHKAIADFRLSEWPKAQGSYAKYYNKHYSVHDMSVVMDYVAEMLFNTKRALIRYSVFSLVNVYYPKSGVSYGILPAPNDAVYEMSDLELTFALTRSPTYETEDKPDYSIRVAQGTFLWGTTFSSSTDFITINIPRNISRTMKLGILSTDLEYLYYILGPWSKNFVRRNKYYLPDKPYSSNNKDNKLTYSKIFNLPIPNLMHRYPYNEWIYNKEMWRRQPNIFNVKAVDDDFCDYYCRYLSKLFFGRIKTKNVVDIENMVIDYLESAVLDFLSLLQGTSDQSNDFDKLNGQSLVYLITNEHGQTLEEYALQLLGKADDMEILKYVLYFSDVRGSIGKLLRGGTVG